MHLKQHRGGGGGMSKIHENSWFDPNHPDQCIWMFPKIVGFSPQIIHFHRVFHYVHHPFWVVFPLFLRKHPYPSDVLDAEAPNIPARGNMLAAYISTRHPSWESLVHQPSTVQLAVTIFDVNLLTSHYNKKTTGKKWAPFVLKCFVPNSHTQITQTTKFSGVVLGRIWTSRKLRAGTPKHGGGRKMMFLSKNGRFLRELPVGFFSFSIFFQRRLNISKMFPKGSCWAPVGFHERFLFPPPATKKSSERIRIST